MKRKSFILLLLTILISFSTISFANMANDVKNTVNGATNTVVDGAQNLTEDVRSGIENAENAIENGARNIGNAITDDANDVMRTDNNNNNSTNDNSDNTNGTAYTATRTTAADITGAARTTSMWTWIILAIAAAVIVGLVWYYAAERNDTH